MRSAEPFETPRVQQSRAGHPDRVFEHDAHRLFADGGRHDDMPGLGITEFVARLAPRERLVGVLDVAALTARRPPRTSRPTTTRGPPVMLTSA